MLKWLVNKNPSSPTPPDILTDDPLATLRLKTVRDSHIYAVSRVNPLFEEEELKSIESQNHNHEENTKKTNTHNEKDQDKILQPPDSPPTDYGSVRSSGYESKESDSLSGNSDEEDGASRKGNQHGLQQPPTAFKDSIILENETNINPLNHISTKRNVSNLRKSFERSGSTLPKSNVKIPNSEFRTYTIPRAKVVSHSSNYVKSIQLGTIRKSFSCEMIPKSTNYDGSLIVPRPMWPKVSHIAESYKLKAEKFEKNKRFQKQNYIPRRRQSEPQIFKTRSQILRFNPIVEVVSKNENYVTDIIVSPRLSTLRNKNIEHNNNGYVTEDINLDNLDNSTHYFNHTSNPTEYPLMSLQPDSLINEHTLKMMDYDIREEQNNYEPEEKPITVPAVTDTTQIMYTRGLYATLNRASSLQARDIVKPPRRNSVNVALTYSKSGAKKRGIDTVRNLWEKSGLKTNGRKLLVDISDLIQDTENYEVDKEQQFKTISQSIQDDSISSHTYEDFAEDEENHNSNIIASTATVEVHKTPMGIDNPTFVDDYGHSNSQHLGKSPLFSNNPSLSENEKIKKFEHKMTQKLEDAPSHRKQWLKPPPLNDSKSSLFNGSTISRRYPTNPGRAVRQELFSSKDTAESDVHLSPLPSPGSGRIGVWTVSETYGNSNNASTSNGKQGFNQPSKYYGTIRDSRNIPIGRPVPRSLSRSFYPHPNSEAISCGPTGKCQDFTLDLNRSVKLMKNNEAREKRRCCYIWCLVFLAFAVFIALIIGISWFCTGGQRVFGPM